MDLKEHFTEVVRIRTGLEKEFPAGTAIYLTSIDRKQRKIVGGRVSVVTPHIAAVMIAQETHRLSNGQEINAWIDEQNRKGARLIQVQQRKDAKGQPSLGETVQELVKAIQSANPPAAPAAAPAPPPVSAPNLSAPPPARHHGNRPVQPPVQAAVTPVQASEALPPAA